MSDPDTSTDRGSNNLLILINRPSLRIFLGLVIFAVIANFIYYRSHTVSIDDARIASDLLVISANRSGWISAMPVQSGQSVRSGQLLAQIDNRAALLALKEMDVEIESKRALIERSNHERQMLAEEQNSALNSHRAEVSSAEAEARAAESALKQSQSNFNRSTTLRDKQLISKKQWEEDQLLLEQAKEKHQQAMSQLNSRVAELRRAETHLLSLKLLDQDINILKQDLEGLLLKHEQLQLDVDDRQIRSPLSGVIDKTFGSVGEYVSPGRRLIMLHNPDDIWITANIKETQVRKIKPGMKAVVHIDAYPDQDFTAVVSKIGNAATSEFALLPNPNPSGNFTKVTQRLQINLSIDQRDGLLKPGMMVEVDIDTRT